MTANQTIIHGLIGRLGLQQRVLPIYRKDFVEKLASVCDKGLCVFAGAPLSDEQIHTVSYLDVAEFVPANNWHIFRIESPLYQCWQFGLIDWLENCQPDVIIVEANPRYRSTPRAVKWMHKRDRPVLGWGLGAPPINGFLASWRQREREHFLHSLDGLIAYSQRGAQEYHALGIPEERIFVSPNAASSKPTTKPPKRPIEFDAHPKVLFVGRLQKRKRIDLLLQACAELSQILTPEVWIVGDGPERENLEQLAASIYPETEFLGAIYGPELDTLFDAADLFILPGTGGLAIQQAMAHALPVIVAEGDGTQGDLVQPKNGWCIPSDDLDALKETLRLALQNPRNLRSMGIESFRIVSEEINLEAMVSVFIRAIESVISKH